MLRLIAAATTGYALGTIPSADVAARLATRGATDLRDAGSGNPGAVNAMAVLGKGWGYGGPLVMAGLSVTAVCVPAREVGGDYYDFLPLDDHRVGVLIADVTKGAAACATGSRLAGAVGAHVGGTAAVVGHCLPVWNGFRGGKGVAASAGQCLATFPAYFPIDLGVALATARWRRQALAATVAASVTWVGAGVVWWRRGWPNLWGPQPSAALPLAAVATSGVILSRFMVARPRVR